LYGPFSADGLTTSLTTRSARSSDVSPLQTSVNGSFTYIGLLQQFQILFHQMQWMSRLLTHERYSAPAPLSSFTPGMTRRWTLPYSGVPRDIRVLVLLNGTACFASKSDVQIVIRGSMSEAPWCRYVRVSNASNTSSRLAFTHVSAFHAGTGEEGTRL
jgi:hypothetical protein